VQKGRTVSNMLYVRYVHLTKAKLICKRQTHFLVREDSYEDYDRKVQLQKEISGREPQGAWRQDEVIDGKPPVVK
jgi:hypothetical protein